VAVNEVLESIWKELAVASFNLLSGGIKENHKEISIGCILADS
jgi:hypothetical protein